MQGAILHYHNHVGLICVHGYIVIRKSDRRYTALRFVAEEVNV